MHLGNAVLCTPLSESSHAHRQVQVSERSWVNKHVSMLTPAFLTFISPWNLNFFSWASFCYRHWSKIWGSSNSLNLWPWCTTPALDPPTSHTVLPVAESTIFLTALVEAQLGFVRREHRSVNISVWYWSYGTKETWNMERGQEVLKGWAGAWGTGPDVMQLLGDI